MKIFKQFKQIKNKILKSKVYKQFGIDLGTANTIIYVKDEGIVVDEPTYVSRNIKTEVVDKIGNNAKKIAGRKPNFIEIIRPLKNGVISNYEMTVTMLEGYLAKISKNSILQGKAIVCVPSGVTQVEKRSFFNVVSDIGISDVYLIEEPIVSAIGAGIDIFEPKGHLIVNVGAGTTEIAFVASGGASKSESIKIAGDNFDNDIIEFIKEQYSIVIGETSAEKLKIIATSAPNDKEEITIKGMGTANGLPQELVIVGSQVDAAIRKNIDKIVEKIKIALEEIEPEISADIYETGIYLTGGGANIRILKQRIEEEFKLKVTVAEDPIHVVVKGMAKIFEDFDKYANIIVPQYMEY
ncbi:rod shape-determining protein [Sneathia sanguinegens]|uniref:Cell shape-determining protein MreB n=1 Tax=Sneathia sanguinegens TaxID=40543 RepID=A0ABT7HJT9_9FUSO|nr:rod shape-determining protein [Sneathia sanguinegens]MDK9580783.1 rod shape-determining protein [Sneathia sanguinegens]MDU4652470.1 rod shape-determining protein [Sneathia sanguinegens]